MSKAAASAASSCAAKHKGVAPELARASTSAPAFNKSSIDSELFEYAASCKGVHPEGNARALGSALNFNNNLTHSVSFLNDAQCSGVFPCPSELAPLLVVPG